MKAASAIAANRFGLGARPGDLEHIGSEGRGWLLAQLDGPAVRLEDPQLRSSQDILRELASKRVKRTTLYRAIYAVETGVRSREAITTDRPFLERLTHFWSNHFAVSVDNPRVLGLAGSFEREAIRPHVLGRFGEMLLAAERHPAMLFYLDNHLSVGPNSRRARRDGDSKPQRRVGLNENLAREILELHTLGVGGGYSQADVTAFAQVISGWTVASSSGPKPARDAGRYRFRSSMHEPGEKAVLGKTYPENGERQGIAVLRDLAARPQTARFIATKLARHFVSDEPSPAVVERLADAFIESGGHLPAVYRALIESPEAWIVPLAKYKTPSDYVFSAYRALSSGTASGGSATKALQVLGQRPFEPGSPAGWPDRAEDWNGASALLKRIEWANALAQRRGATLDAQQLAPRVLGEALGAPARASLAGASNAAQALTLLLTAPEFMRR